MARNRNSLATGRDIDPVFNVPQYGAPPAEVIRHHARLLEALSNDLPDATSREGVTLEDILAGDA